MKGLSRKVILAIVSCWLAPLLAVAQGGASAAVLPENSYRFGTAIEGETVRHDFILHNKGSGDLRIEKIKTG